MEKNNNKKPEYKNLIIKIKLNLWTSTTYYGR